MPRKKVTRSPSKRRSTVTGRKADSSSSDNGSETTSGRASHGPAHAEGRRRAKGGDTTLSKKMAEDFFRRVKEIKQKNPESSRLVDKHERLIHQSLWNIRNAIDEMGKEEKELVRILVINGLYKATDDILLDD